MVFSPIHLGGKSLASNETYQPNSQIVSEVKNEDVCPVTGDHVIDNNIVYLDDIDSDYIKIRFNLCEFEFYQLSSGNIDLSDNYKFENQTLFIKKDFIIEDFSLKPRRNTYIFSYVLKSDNEVKIGYIFVFR